MLIFDVGRVLDIFKFIGHLVGCLAVVNECLRVYCIVVKCCLKGKRAINPAYPVNLNTLGDHLRKIRLDRRLSQPDVALLNFHLMTVIYAVVVW